MEAKFAQTKRTANFFIAALVIIMLVGSFAAAFSGNIGIGIAILLAVLITLNVLIINFKGKITADENGVLVVITFFGIKIRKKFIEYSEIQGTDCGVDTERGRVGVRYTMEFTLKMKDGSKIVLLNLMNIGASFPATEPEKYKEYLHEQPLMQISHYIDNKLHLNTSA